MASINNKTAGAGFFGGGGGGGGGGGSPGGTNGQIQYNNSGAFGGKDISQLQSPFAPSGFANVSTMNNWSDLAVSPDGLYVYVCGVLTANSHGAIAQVKIADGTVKATCDLGAGVSPQGIAVSPDSSAIYAYDKTDGLTWWKIATSGMSITHTSTLAVAVAHTTAQQFDLSPDGSSFAYVSGADAKLYMINTSTYAVTNQTMSHTAGNLTSVCFYNGSNSNVYVAHAGSGVVDLYAIGGAYTSSVSTGAGGTPAFNAMRSGINGNFFIADGGTNNSVIQVASGTPIIMSSSGAARSLAVNSGSQTAIADGGDDCYFIAGLTPTGTSNIYEIPSSGTPSPIQILSPWSVAYNGALGLAVAPDTSERLFTLSGVNYPEVWNMAAVPDTTYPLSVGNVKTSDGKGNWTSAAPFSTTGWTGSGTLSGGGTVTITTAVATTSSIFSICPTGTANVLPPAVTTKSAGSFVVTGTATGTFDWTILKP